VAGLTRILLWPSGALVQARGTLFPWVPVAIGCGIGLWFALPWEPGTGFYLLLTLLLAAGIGLRLSGAELAHPPAVILVCLCLGALAAGYRAHGQAAPMLDFRYYGPIQGRIVEIDRSQSDALRLTLDQVVLGDVAVARTPLKVRVSLQGKSPQMAFVPGQVVMLTGHLTAPQGPVEPGAFDFRRMAWFDQLGAVGYSPNPVMLWAEPQGRDQAIARLRTWLSNGIMAAVPGDAGAFASGVMTGDRSGLSLDAVQALRDSSLAHLLAISGMNMAFLSAFVFALIRYGIALVPPVALRVNAKKVAAVVAFGVALFYLLLSGANVATERAFIMVSVMLGAVLLDRRALTLRSVSISAILLLLWQPESLLGPGFQMSYAATVALIAGFAAVEGRVLHERLPRWAMPVFTLVLSSVIGGLATAPYAAAHFNRFTDYGLIANLLTVPVMGAVVMPAGAVAALLAPFGLAAVPLWVMEQGARWILHVAHWIADLEGAVTAIPAPGPWVLPLVTLGGVWLVVWQGRLRLAAGAPLALALGLWIGGDRPLALIDEAGGLVGVMGAEGRALSAGKGAGFAATNWLENDGDLAGQEDAAKRVAFSGPKGARAFRLADWSGIVLSGKGAAGRVDAACAAHDLVIVSEVSDIVVPGCLVFDAAKLRATGPLALRHDAGKGLLIEPAHQVPRLWSRPYPPQAPVWLPPPRGTGTEDGQRLADR
jgi:competence protein ComEC